MPQLKNEAPQILFNVKNYLDTELNNRTNVPWPREIFEGDKTTEKGDMTQVATLEIDFGGALKSPFLELNHF